MIKPFIDDFFLFYFGMTDVIYECPSDTSSIAGVNKTILRAGIQGILPIHKFRMKHYVTLLARRFQIRQALPCFQVFCSCNTCNGYCGR